MRTPKPSSGATRGFLSIYLVFKGCIGIERASQPPRWILWVLKFLSKVYRAWSSPDGIHCHLNGQLILQQPWEISNGLCWVWWDRNAKPKLLGASWGFRNLQRAIRPRHISTETNTDTFWPNPSLGRLGNMGNYKSYPLFWPQHPLYCCLVGSGLENIQKYT